MTPSRPITKELFASGLQCAKRLYLDYHHPDAAEESSPRRQALAAIGVQMIELARSAFPRSETADADDTATAVEQTRGWLRDAPNVAVFDAAFTAGDLEVRTDIAIPDGKGAVDVYEVKSGTKVKNRHVRDLAFQVYTIEQCGFTVHQAWVLHLNTQYEFRGGTNHPVHQLFKNVDVTTKVRGQLARTAEQIESFRRAIADASTRELPTGTWCQLPFPCPHLDQCRSEGPEHPLIDLPELSRELEAELHEQGIEDLTQVEPEREGLTLSQRRAVRAVQTGTLLVEPFVGRELRDVEYPLHFISHSSLLQVLPIFEGSHPWLHIPIAWHDLIVHEDGTTENKSHVPDGKTDPRPEFVMSLAEALQSPGTVMTFGPTLDYRLRDLMDELPEQKSELRAILGQARFDLQALLKMGVYHPGLRASFDLASVHAMVSGDRDVGDEDEAHAACQRLLNSRTRAPTRKKLAVELAEFGARRCAAIHRVYGALLEATQDATADR